MQRQYDSLRSGEDGTLGHGWRLPIRDFALTSDVAIGATAGLPAYQMGTRVYLTLPNGDREAFTFAPEAHSIAGLAYYSPKWVSASGSTWTLDSYDVKLQRSGDRFYVLETGQPYSPETHAGEQFTLTEAQWHALFADFRQWRNTNPFRGWRDLESRRFGHRRLERRARELLHQ